MMIFRVGFTNEVEVNAREKFHKYPKISQGFVHFINFGIKFNLLTRETQRNVVSFGSNYLIFDIHIITPLVSI